MGTEFAIMSAIICKIFPSRMSVVMAVDFVLTCLAIQFAMLFPFWQDCAVMFFMVFALKEACIALQFDSAAMCRCYAVSGIMQLLCALEIAFSPSFYFYAHYEVIMTACCLAKITSCVDWQSLRLRGIVYGC